MSSTVTVRSLRGIGPPVVLAGGLIGADGNALVGEGVDASVAEGIEVAVGLVVEGKEGGVEAALVAVGVDVRIGLALGVGATVGLQATTTMRTASTTSLRNMLVSLPADRITSG
jgi:hypothetical protein